LPNRFRTVLIALAVFLLVLGRGSAFRSSRSLRSRPWEAARLDGDHREGLGKEGPPFVVGPRNPRWTPYGAIPAALKKAVVASEDAHFYSHEGVDYEAIREAIKADWRKGSSSAAGARSRSSWRRTSSSPGEDADPEGQGTGPRAAHGRTRCRNRGSSSCTSTWWNSVRWCTGSATRRTTTSGSTLPR